MSPGKKDRALESYSEWAFYVLSLSPEHRFIVQGIKALRYKPEKPGLSGLSEETGSRGMPMAWMREQGWYQRSRVGDKIRVAGKALKPLAMTGCPELSNECLGRF